MTHPHDDLELTPKAHPVVPEGFVAPPSAMERTSSLTAMWRKVRDMKIGFTPKQLVVGVPFLCTLGWTASHYEREFQDQLARADRTEQLVKWQTKALHAIARHDGIQLPPMPNDDDAGPLLAPIGQTPVASPPGAPTLASVKEP